MENAQNGQDWQQQVEEATPKFVDAALSHRLKELFPQITDEQLPKIVAIVHEDMRSELDTGMMDKLAAFDLGERESVQQQVFQMQWAIGGAISGLGIDILEPDAVDQIIWFREEK